MTDYTIMNADDEPDQKDVLAFYLMSVPRDEGTTLLVAELFERAQVKERKSQFRLRHFMNIKQDSHGLVVGFTDIVVIFWRSDTGYFWVHRNKVSFQHEAAFLTGTRAPFVDKPRIKTCYLFRTSHEKILATPFKPCSAADTYLNILRTNKAMRENSKQKEDQTTSDSALTAFRPIKGFTLLESELS